MSTEKTCGIYAIRRNKMVYIGHSSNIATRWLKHRSELRRDKHPNPHLQNAWNLYGPDAFEFIILEECDPERLIEREQFHMDQYPDSYNYAPVAGSRLGYRHRPESIEKMIGNTNSAGREVSSETRKKISAALTGRKVSDETREKMRQAAMRRVVSPEGRASIKAAALARESRKREARVVSDD